MRPIENDLRTSFALKCKKLCIIILPAVVLMTIRLGRDQYFCVRLKAVGLAPSRAIIAHSFEEICITDTRHYYLQENIVGL